MRFQPATRRTRRSALVLFTGLALFGPVAAAQASGDDVWHDCAIGGVDQPHSQADYRDALANPVGDGAEYSDCADQIRRAQTRALNKGSGQTGGITYGKTPTIASPLQPADAVSPAALGKALASSGVPGAGQPGGGTGSVKAPAPVTVDGERLDLASAATPSIADATSLPLPLALGALSLVLVALAPLGRRVNAWRASRSGTPGGNA